MYNNQGRSNGPKLLVDYTGKKFTGSAELELDNAFNNVFYYSIISRIEVL